MINPQDYPKYLPPANPIRAERDSKIINDRAKGITLTKLAKKYGLCLDRIHQIVNDDEAKLIIDTIPKIHITHAIDNQYTLQDMAQAKGKFEKISHKEQRGAIHDCNDLIGITGTHTPPGVKQYYQINQFNMALVPEALDLLMRHKDHDDDVMEGIFDSDHE